MKKYLFASLLILVLLASCKGKHSDKSASNSSIEVLKQALPDSVKLYIDSKVLDLAKKSKSIVTAVVSKDSSQAYYAGYDGRNNKLITDFTTLNEIGSNTKLFTATAVLQLIEQHKFSLDDPLMSILQIPELNELLIIDGENYIDSVKVVHLLNHTSGLPEYFVDDDDEEIELHGDPSLVFTANDLIGMAKDNITNPLIPGSSFNYCNLNYVLLGMIIEKFSGQTYQQYMQEHIIDKLQLKNTYLGTINLPEKRAQGHYKGEDSFMPFTLAGPAGEIIMDLEDMDKFIGSWYKGELFENPKTMQSILNDHYHEMANGINYGMGVVSIFNKSYGHAGQTFGFQSYMCNLTNNYRFAFIIDDASVSAWNLAIEFTSDLSKLN